MQLVVKRIRTMESHHMPVGALAWSFSLLSCGSRDKRILHHDIHAQEDYVSKLTGHKSEVIYSSLMLLTYFLPRSSPPFSKGDNAAAGCQVC